MPLFLHNSGALNANQSDTVLYIASFTCKIETQKMAAKTTSHLFFRQMNAQFLVSASFGVEKCMSNVFRSK